VPFIPAWRVSQTLKSSMSSRRIWATDVMLVLARSHRVSCRSAVREERFQIERHCPQHIRASPARHKLQITI